MSIRRLMQIGVGALLAAMMSPTAALPIVESAGMAASAEEAAPALPAAADACLMCHDDPAVTPILHGPHSVTADARTGFAEQGCGSCHGASIEHMQRPARGSPRAAPDRVFDAQAGMPVAQQNAVCLDCHRGSAGFHWIGSAHETEPLACVDCHRVHVSADPMRDPHQQNATCTHCHRKTAAELQRPSAHPLQDGQMACADCHAAHGSAAPSLLVRPTVNETCYGCHAEMRGPFLWEHPPAREDCMNCHQPHGAVHRPLLTQRAPWLCQQCHLAQFHPSAALSGTGLPGDSLPSGSPSLLGRNCMNCHGQVHGSNHPSGAGFTR